MKTLLFWFALGSTQLLASDPVAPAFSAAIDAPALSLLDAAKEKLPPIFGERSFPVVRRPSTSVLPPKIVSRMPIISPHDERIDPASVKRPDESKDYKLQIRSPAIESVK
jgi:hypothetical protein